MHNTYKNVIGWIISALLALSFLFAGYHKIPPGTGMVKRFEAWGYSADFALLIGVLELISGMLVLVPKLAAYGGFFIVVLMAGATYTHMSTGIGSPMFAIIYLVLALVLIYLRKEQTLFLSGLFKK